MKGFQILNDTSTKHSVNILWIWNIMRYLKMKRKILPVGGGAEK